MTEHSQDLSSEMTLAVRAQAAHVYSAHQLNRIDWTQDQWIEDADRLMGDIDGSVLALKNGHVLALLGKVKSLQAENASLRAQILGAPDRAVDNKRGPV